MKNVIIILILLSLSSCTPTMYQHNCNCDAIDMKSLFTSISASLAKENMQIATSDINIGYLEARSKPAYSVLTGGTYTNIWVIQYENGKIIAYAKLLTETKNAFGVTLASSEGYYNDKASNDVGWYWNVRDDIEKLCKGKIEVIEYKETSSRRRKTTETEAK